MSNFNENFAYPYSATQFPFTQFDDFQIPIDPNPNVIFEQPGPHVLYDNVELFGYQLPLTTTPQQPYQYLPYSHPNNHHNTPQYQDYLHLLDPTQNGIFAIQEPLVPLNLNQSFGEPPLLTTHQTIPPFLHPATLEPQGGIPPPILTVDPRQIQQTFLYPTTLEPQSGTSTASNLRGVAKRGRHSCPHCDYTSDRRENIRAHELSHVTKAQLAKEGKLHYCALPGCRNRSGFKRLADVRRHATTCTSRRKKVAPRVPKIAEVPSSKPSPPQQSSSSFGLTLDPGDLASSSQSLIQSSSSQSQFPFPNLIFPS